MKTVTINYPDLVKASSRKPCSTNVFSYSSSEFKEYFKKLKNKQYFIKTYGCQANIRDEETMKGMLDEVGYRFTDNLDECSLIIINTCAVRENAEDKVYGEIGNLKKYYSKNKNLIIAICGCMVEQPEILEKLLNTFPHITLYFGTHEISSLLSYIYQVQTKHIRLVDIKSQQGDVVEKLPSTRNNNYKAFVNIIYGCNKFCSYCIVPYTRGKERSRSFNEIMDEVRILKKANYQEITFLGQNVNAYGKDLLEGRDFADILEEAAKMGIPRIRFTTSHPWDFSSKMIDVIAKYPNIMKCIHLPVQSGNSNILKKMGRRYDREQYLSLVSEMRKKIPGLSLSTDIIVGFPNETEEEFNDTLSLVDEVKYESAFTFIYSPRKGTPAAKMIDNVSKEDKGRRFKELVSHLEKHISKDANEYVGNTYPVLVDCVSKTDNQMLSGYTESNKLVHFKGDIKLIGKIVNIKITESHTYSLIGELINE